MIGEVLKQVMDEKNIKVSQLSELSGIKAQTIYSIIKRNNTKVEFGTLLKLCKTLGVSIERFYDDYIDNQAEPETVYLTSHEKKVVTAYRDQPEMQPAVDRILGVPSEEE